MCVDFKNLNWAFLNDCFPLSKIDQLVDSTLGHAWISFLDTCWGYHQIEIHEPDRENTYFITPLGIFCYKIMPSRLKNVRACIMEYYGRLHRDMVVKSKEEQDRLQAPTEVFEILKKIQVEANRG